MGFFHDITTTYGDEATSLLKQWAKLNKNLAACRNKKVFLLQCRHHRIFPSHINNNVNVLYRNFEYNHKYIYHINNILNNTKKSMLNLEIQITLSQIHRLQSIIDKNKQRLSILISDIIIQDFTRKQQVFYNNQFEHIRTKQIDKFKRLLLKYNNFNCSSTDDCFVNLTDEIIPDNVKCVLALGPQFAVENNRKDFPLVKLITDVEYCISSQQHLDDHSKNELRAKTTNIITNHINKSKNVKQFNVMDNNLSITKKFLKNKPDLIVTNSDKSKCTVLMYKVHYINKMKELLSDSNTYKILKNDPTIKYQNKNNKIVKELLDKEMIDYITYYRLRIVNAVSPKIYGLPKIHKPPPIPLRPVVSCINSPTYGIAKFLSQILNNLLTHFTYNVRNSSEFVNFIKDVRLPDDYILVSLDVKSLFTNIPKDMVCQEIINNWDILCQHTSLNLDMILMITEFCFESSYFSFNNECYRQLFGTAMGNPASPIFANLVMNKALTVIINKLQVKIPFLKLYVDDIVTAIPKHSVDEVLACFNAYNDNIQFTIEIENNRSLPFLDIMLIRTASNHIITDYYSKPTTSNRILNFHSSHPIKQKVSIIKGFLHRINNICHPSFLKTNILKLKVKLINNNYPTGFIDKCLQSKNSNNTDIEDVTQMYTYYKIPYIRSLSEKIARMLQNDVVKITLYNTKKLNHVFSRLKDQTPMEYRSNVIYKIKCTECDSAYVGQTKQYLKNRIKNHIYDCRITNSNLDKTALSAHHFDLNHNFDFNNVKILQEEHNLKKRLFLEMVHISLTQNSINNRTDMDNLSKVYSNLFKL